MIVVSVESVDEGGRGRPGLVGGHGAHSGLKGALVDGARGYVPEPEPETFINREGRGGDEGYYVGVADADVPAKYEHGVPDMGPG